MDNELPLDGRMAVERFLQAWRDRNWESAAASTTLTFRDHAIRTTAPASMLKKMFGGERLISFRIRKATPGVVDMTGINHLTQGVLIFFCDVEVRLVRLVGDRQQPLRVIIRAVCETAPHVSDRDGEWGVNPFSWSRPAKVSGKATNGVIRL